MTVASPKRQHAAPKPAPVDHTATVFKAIGDPKRLEVLRLLMRKPRSVGSLAKALDLEVANLSYHLKILRTAGIVEPRPEGQRRVYHICGRQRLGTLYLKLDGGINVKVPLLDRSAATA